MIAISRRRHGGSLQHVATLPSGYLHDAATAGGRCEHRTVGESTPILGKPAKPWHRAIFVAIIQPMG